MNSEQVRLVQDSFRQFAPIADWASGVFYARLFELDPGMSTPFKGDYSQQGRELTRTLALAVESLDRVEMFVPVVRDLGTLYADHGARGKDYKTVRCALLWTLRQVLGDAFTPELEAAWAEAYAALAAAMQERAAVGGPALAYAR
jgi:hemoglobin-like flavoprotein